MLMNGSQTEFRMNQICEGLKTKQEVIDETLDEYREMYTKTQQEFATLSNVRPSSLSHPIVSKENTKLISMAWVDGRSIYQRRTR